MAKLYAVKVCASLEGLVERSVRLERLRRLPQKAGGLEIFVIIVFTMLSGFSMIP